MSHSSTLRFKRDEILQAVRANRAKHEAEWLRVHTLYQQHLIRFYRRALRVAKSGQTPSEHPPQPPTAYVKDYDRAIRMFELTCTEEVELDPQTFSELVLDDWSWKNRFHNQSLQWCGAGKRHLRVKTPEREGMR